MARGAGGGMYARLGKGREEQREWGERQTERKKGKID